MGFNRALPTQDVLFQNWIDLHGASCSREVPETIMHALGITHDEEETDSDVWEAARRRLVMILVEITHPNDVVLLAALMHWVTYIPLRVPIASTVEMMVDVLARANRVMAAERLIDTISRMAQKEADEYRFALTVTLYTATGKSAYVQMLRSLATSIMSKAEEGVDCEPPLEAYCVIYACSGQCDDLVRARASLCTRHPDHRAAACVDLAELTGEAVDMLHALEELEGVFDNPSVPIQEYVNRMMLVFVDRADPTSTPSSEQPGWTLEHVQVLIKEFLKRAPRIFKQYYADMPQHYRLEVQGCTPSEHRVNVRNGTRSESN